MRGKGRRRERAGEWLSGYGQQGSRRVGGVKKPKGEAAMGSR